MLESQQHSKHIRLELVLLMATFIVFPLDEWLATVVFGKVGTDDGITAAHMFTMLLLVVCGWKALWKRDSEPLRLPVSRSVTIMIMAYIGATILSMLVSRFPSNSIGFVIQRISTFVFYLLILYIVRDRRDLHLCVAAFVTGALFAGVAGGYEILTGNSVLPEFRFSETLHRVGLAAEATGSYRVQGLSREAGRHACQLLLQLGLALYLLWIARRWHKRMAIGTLVALILVNVIAASSRSLWLGLFIVLATFLLAAPLPRKKLTLSAGAAVLVTVFMLFIVFFPQVAVKDRLFSIRDAGSFSTHHRKNMLLLSIEMGRLNPWLGIGSGNFMQEYQRFAHKFPFLPMRVANPPHNAYTGLFAENGIIGVIVYITMQLFVLWQIVVVLLSSSDQQSKFLAAGLLAAFIGFLYTLTWGVMLGSKYGWTIMAFTGALSKMSDSRHLT